jgi:hypothetical protein
MIHNGVNDFINFRCACEAGASLVDSEGELRLDAVTVCRNAKQEEKGAENGTLKKFSVYVYFCQNLILEMLYPRQTLSGLTSSHSL